MKKVKIPVFATLGLAYRFVWFERRDFITLALVPMVILAALETAVEPGLSASGEAGRFSIPGIIIIILVNVAAGVMFMVAWYRRYLIPRENATFYVAYRWRARHGRYLFVSVTIGLLAVFAAALPVLFGALFGPLVVLFLLVSVVVSGLVAARLSMLLPSTAVDDLINFNQALELSHRNTWRIFAVFVLSAIPIGIAAPAANLILGSLFGVAPGLPGIFVMSFTNEFFGFVSAALGVTVLSEAYRILRGGITSTTLPPAPRLD